MRIILSRKGFDASYGGVASPILPDGRMWSLPIPLADPLTFGEIAYDGQELGTVVAHLTRGSYGPTSSVHLDPDLRRDARPRAKGWLPAFGQSGAAAKHLEKQGVGVGDVFLFFGWFRATRGTCPALAYAPSARDIHAIFGWLQIGEIIRPDTNSPTSIPSWLRPHPHVSGGAANDKCNTIYVASPMITLDGQTLKVPGGGVFPRFAPQLQLTAPHSRTRRTWYLPAWFSGEPYLTYHSRAARWTPEGSGVTLETVGRGQEFVLDLTTRPKANAWLRDLLETQSATA